MYYYLYIIKVIQKKCAGEIVFQVFMQQRLSKKVAFNQNIIVSYHVMYTFIYIYIQEYQLHFGLKKKPKTRISLQNYAWAWFQELIW